MENSKITSEPTAQNIFDEIESMNMQEWQQVLKKLTTLLDQDPQMDTTELLDLCLRAYYDLTDEQQTLVQNDLITLGKSLGYTKTEWLRKWKKLIRKYREVVKDIPTGVPTDDTFSDCDGMLSDVITELNTIYLTDEQGESKPAGDLQEEIFDQFFEDNKMNPTIFYKGGFIQILENTLKPIQHTDMQYHLQKRFKWYTITSRKSGDAIIFIEKNVNPIPSHVPKMLMANPRQTQLPNIRAVVNHPIFTQNGELITSQGYVHEAKVFIQTDYSDIKILDSVSEAVDFYTEAFQYFPFRDEYSRAIAFAYPLTLLFRNGIDGLVPFFHSGASRAGSGKTKLFDENHRVVFGTDLYKMGIPVKDNKEKASHIPSWAEPNLERKVGQQLVKGRVSWMFDNAANGAELDSPYLCLLATAETLDVKVLYEQNFRTIPNESVVVFTGNNLRFVGDLQRRVVHCYLQPDTEFPEQRQLPNLTAYINEHRNKLLSCLCTIIDAWFKQGCPKVDIPFGSYENWASTIGGILQVMDITDFLPTHRDLSAHDLAVRQFVFAVWKEKKTDRWAAKDIIHIALQAKDSDGTHAGQNILGELDGVPSNPDNWKQYIGRKFLPTLDRKVFEDKDIKLQVNRIPNTNPVYYEIQPLK